MITLYRRYFLLPFAWRNGKVRSSGTHRYVERPSSLLNIQRSTRDASFTIKSQQHHSDIVMLLHTFRKGLDLLQHPINHLLHRAFL